MPFSGNRVVLQGEYLLIAQLQIEILGLKTECIEESEFAPSSYCFSFSILHHL